MGARVIVARSASSHPPDHPVTIKPNSSSTRGEPGERANQLIAHRHAHVIATPGADDYFATLGEKTHALEDFARLHPLSTEAAVATLKKYLSEPKYRIALDDLVKGEVARARALPGRPTGGRHERGNSVRQVVQDMLIDLAKTKERLDGMLG